MRAVPSGSPGHEQGLSRESHHGSGTGSGTLLEMFELSLALAIIMDRLRLGAGLLRQDGTGSGREGRSVASSHASLVLDSRRGAA
jgi:hypothetical protein